MESVLPWEALRSGNYLAIQTSDPVERMADAPNAPFAGPEETPTSLIKSVEGNTVIFPTGTRCILICLALAFSMVLPVLDISIIATAIPSIADEFQDSSDVGWYGSAYLFTLAIMQLPFGKLCTLFSPKGCFITAMIIFEVGSIITALAPNSKVLILGRAIAGLGDSGIIAGALNIITYTLPLHLRPTLNGAIGIILSGVSAIGPPLGGVLTAKASWRWCFGINPIFGFPTILLIVILLKDLETPPRQRGTVREKLAQLDIIGFAAVFFSILCLLLALQWGGMAYAWSSAQMVVLLVLSVLFMVAFIVIEWLKEDQAMLPLAIFRQRSISAGVLYCFTMAAGGETISYYLPTWFQAVKGVDALKSGLMVLPLTVSNLSSGLVSGMLITKFGYYAPFMCFGSVVGVIGSVLITRFRPDTGPALWVPTLLLVGFGIGTGIEQPQIAAQTVLGPEQVPLGIGVVICAQFLGQAIFISVIGNLLNNDIDARVHAQFPGIDADVPVTQSPTALRHLVLADDLPAMEHLLSGAICKTFYVCLAMVVLSLLAACAMEWRSVIEELAVPAEDVEKEGILAIQNPLSPVQEDVPGSSETNAPTIKPIKVMGGLEGIAVCV